MITLAIIAAIGILGAGVEIGLAIGIGRFIKTGTTAPERPQQTMVIVSMRRGTFFDRQV